MHATPLGRKLLYTTQSEGSEHIDYEVAAFWEHREHIYWNKWSRTALGGADTAAPLVNMQLRRFVLYTSFFTNNNIQGGPN